MEGVAEGGGVPSFSLKPTSDENKHGLDTIQAMLERKRLLREIRSWAEDEIDRWENNKEKAKHKAKLGDVDSMQAVDWIKGRIEMLNETVAKLREMEGEINCENCADREDTSKLKSEEELNRLDNEDKCNNCETQLAENYCCLSCESSFCEDCFVDIHDQEECFVDHTKRIRKETAREIFKELENNYFLTRKRSGIFLNEALEELKKKFGVE